MAQFDLNDVIRAAVSDEINRVLGPHLDTLNRLSAAFGGTTINRAAPARRGPGRPPAAAGRRRAGRRRAARAGGRGDASKFSTGQTVRYKQGRGEFEAKVIAINTEDNTLTLERLSDGKRVDRPAAKVY